MFDDSTVWARVMADLAHLPDDEHAEVVTHLMERVEASGACTRDQVDRVLQAWSEGRPVVPSDDPTFSAWAHRVELDLGRLTAVVEELRSLASAEALPEGLSDRQVLEAIVAAEQASRIAMSLRGIGMHALRGQVMTPGPGSDPDDSDGEAGLERERKLRRLARRKVRNLPLRGRSVDDVAQLDKAEQALLAEAFAVTETALALGISERAAGQCWDVHAALPTLPVTTGGLRTGRLEWAKAKATVDLLIDRPIDVQRSVEERVVVYALSGPKQRYRTVPALRNAIKALLLELDPPAPEDVDHERDRRRVWTRPAPTCTPGSEGMGELVAYLPLADIARIGARLDAAVLEARRARDPRTDDQVRADLLTDLLISGTLGAGPQVTAQVLLTMTVETLLGLTRNDPALLRHYGPVGADIARDLAEHATFRCAAVDDAHGTLLGLGQGTFRTGYVPGARLQDLQRTTWVRCSFPGCPTRIDRSCSTLADLDHIVSWPEGPTCACNTQPLCRRHHRMKTHGEIVLESSTDPDDPPGTMHWRLPSGHVHTSRPDPAVPWITSRPKAQPVTPLYQPPPAEPPPF